MSEVISIQPRILFCILILIVTEHFLRGRDNIIDIELLFLATHEVLWSANTPIDVASVGAFDVVICVFALGHDPILAYAALASFQFVVQVDCSHEASAILAVVVIGPRAIWKSPILTTHFCYLVHFITATAFALKRNWNGRLLNGLSETCLFLTRFGLQSRKIVLISNGNVTFELSWQRHRFISPAGHVSKTAFIGQFRESLGVFGSPLQKHVPGLHTR